jgi:hypothetical protein
MYSVSDDELYAVQGRYLGPPGKTLPWQARYIAYAVFAGYLFGLLILRQQLRILPGGGGYVVLVLASVLSTIATMRLVTPERPVTAVLAGFWADIGAPRPGGGTTYYGAPDLRRVLISTERPRPRHRRQTEQKGGRR